MKTKRLVLLFITLVAIVSCKDEKKPEATVAEAPKTDNLFTVTLNATVLKDDSFQLYYRQVGINQYEEKNSLFVEFKGSPAPQDIVFRLPEDVIPEFIRLDFGVNKQQSVIKVNSFKMDYFGKEFKVDGVNFFNFLQVAETTMKLDKANATVTPFEKNGSYDPITTSELGLKTEIEKLVK